MAIRTQLLATSNLVPPPVIVPLFDPHDWMARMGRRGRSWTECSPEEIYRDINDMFMHGTSGVTERGLLL